jgi:hypothetical protein
VFRRCDFKNHLKEYQILRQFDVNTTDHSVWNGFFDLFQQRNVSLKDLNFLRSQVYSSLIEPEKRLETKMEYIQKVKESPFLLKMLYRTYYYDFLIFGYELPNI